MKCLSESVWPLLASRKKGSLSFPQAMGDIIKNKDGNKQDRKDRWVLRRREENRKRKNYISKNIGYFFSFLPAEQMACLETLAFPHNLLESSGQKPDPSCHGAIYIS